MRISDWSSDVCSSDLDMGALGVLPPGIEPKVTEHIDAIIAMIGRLIANGHAYEAEGQVLFHVPSFAGYGQLSRRDRDDMIAGARVDVAPYKRDPADFTLWKPSPPDMTGWDRSEEHTSELQSLMRISYAVFCLKTKIPTQQK